MKTILVDAMGTLVIEEEGPEGKQASNGVKLYQPLYELLETYPNRKIVLTMAPDELMEKWGLNDLPYEVFTSKLDPKKSDPKYYRMVLEKFGLNVGDVVLFEHDLEAVKSAQSLGITAHHYDSEKKDLDALKQFLDVNL